VPQTSVAVLYEIEVHIFPTSVGTVSAAMLPTIGKKQVVRVCGLVLMFYESASRTMCGLLLVLVHL
jgi:hypothetical protein